MQPGTSANRAEAIARPAMLASNAAPGFTGTIGPSVRRERRRRRAAAACRGPARRRAWPSRSTRLRPSSSPASGGREVPSHPAARRALAERRAPRKHCRQRYRRFRYPGGATVRSVSLLVRREGGPPVCLRACLSIHPFWSSSRSVRTWIRCPLCKRPRGSRTASIRTIANITQVQIANAGLTGRIMPADLGRYGAAKLIAEGVAAQDALLMIGYKRIPMPAPGQRTGSRILRTLPPARVIVLAGCCSRRRESAITAKLRGRRRLRPPVPFAPTTATDGSSKGSGATRNSVGLNSRDSRFTEN